MWILTPIRRDHIIMKGFLPMLRALLTSHLRRYPKMQATDCAKLIYQSAFAGGHLIPSPEYALNRLKSEWSASAPDCYVPLLEPVGNGVSRLYVEPARRMGLRPETVSALFVQTSVCFQKNAVLFEQEMAEAAAMADEGLLPFPGGELRALADDCRKTDFAPFSHSAVYREAYMPAYRLVLDRSLRYLAVFAAIDTLLSEKGCARVAIDGCSGSGKSTLGQLLGGIYGAQLFHMDDFFLPHERKTPERLAEPGGNVDYERFQSDVLDRLDDERFSYRPYVCHEGALGEAIATEKRPVQIIEGSYSQHPKLNGRYDLRVFLTLSPKAQSARILKRNGAAMHARFMNEWVPLENRYFEAFHILSQADIVYWG